MGIPLNLKDGAYFLGAITDDTSRVSESAEGNNTALNSRGSVNLLPAARPDLVIPSFSMPASAYLGGAAAGMKVQVRNQGDASAPPYRLGFYFSTTPTFHYGDAQSTSYCRPTADLPAGESWSCAGDVFIPASLSEGTYYVYAWADNYGEITESDETNNRRFSDAGVIRLSEAPKPDLVISAFTAPLDTTIGGDANIALTVWNQGKAAAGAFRVGFYLSTNAVISGADTYTGWSCTFKDGLSAGASSTCSGQIGVPSTLAPGTYYFGALADDTGEVTEGDEGNNGRANDRGSSVVHR